MDLLSPDVLSLLKLHFSFVIIAGGQLILFNQIVEATEKSNDSLRKGGTRFFNMVRALLVAEYILFGFVFILTLFLLLFRIKGWDWRWDYYEHNMTFILNYIYILLAVMLLQAIARINLVKIRSIEAVDADIQSGV